MLQLTQWSFDFTFAEHGEGLQVLHYQAGQKYEPHFDYFNDEFNTKNGGQRIATVLMYLYVYSSSIHNQRKLNFFVYICNAHYPYRKNLFSQSLGV